MLHDVDNIITYDRNAWLIQWSPLWLWVECPFLCSSVSLPVSLTPVLLLLLSSLPWNGWTRSDTNGAASTCLLWNKWKMKHTNWRYYVRERARDLGRYAEDQEFWHSSRHIRLCLEKRVTIVFTLDSAKPSYFIVWSRIRKRLLSPLLS